MAVGRVWYPDENVFQDVNPIFNRAVVATSTSPCSKLSLENIPCLRVTNSEPPEMPNKLRELDEIQQQAQRGRGD